MSIVIIEDELHDHDQGKFPSVEDAVSELQRRAAIPWDQEPNRAPCTNWKNCGRHYEIAEYDDSGRPWREIRRYRALNISASGIVWSSDLQDLDSTSLT